MGSNITSLICTALHLIFRVVVMMAFCGHPLASVNISSNAHKMCTLQSVYCSYPHNLPWSFHMFERMPHSLLCTLKLTLWAPLRKSAHFSANGATWNYKYMTQKAQNRNPTFTVICGRVLIPLSRPLNSCLISGVDFFFLSLTPIKYVWKNNHYLFYMTWVSSRQWPVLWDQALLACTIIILMDSDGVLSTQILEALMIVM